MTHKREKITVLIPCYNEERGIGAVIESFPIEEINNRGYEIEIVVIDNNSSDKTSEIARSLGATVLHEPKKGKGNAIRLGFEYVKDSTDYVVMLDGDNTYLPAEVLHLIEPLRAGSSNVVIGSRLEGFISRGSMKSLNKIGNWIFSRLVSVFYRVKVTDVLTGYFAWKRKSLKKLAPHLISNGFAIEMEMVTKMARLGEMIVSIPISYNSRDGETNLRPIHDGLRILAMFLRNLFWKPVISNDVQRFAFVSDAVLSWHKGGKEKRLYEVTKRLISDNNEVHIYTMKWWKKGPKTIMKNNIYYHAICRYYPLYNGARRSILQAVMFGLATFKMIFVKFDVIEVDHMPYFPVLSARIVTWLRNKKLYVTWHEVWGKAYWVEYLKGPVGIIGYYIETVSMMLPDVIISISEHTTERLRKSGTRSIIKTIPLGVDLDNIYNAEEDKEKSDVIFVGRFLNHKKVDILVEAIGIVKKEKPDVVCKIIGSGPEEENIKKLIKKLGLENNIELVGPIEDHIELYGIMKASKMFVLPSVREGFGLVVIEAQAAGLPVITTSHKDNAAQYLIDEGINGFVAHADKQSIADSIIEILEIHPTMDPKKGIEKYDWQIVTNDLKQAFL